MRTEIHSSKQCHALRSVILMTQGMYYGEASTTSDPVITQEYYALTSSHNRLSLITANVQDKYRLWRGARALDDPSASDLVSPKAHGSLQYRKTILFANLLISASCESFKYILLTEAVFIFTHPLRSCFIFEMSCFNHRALHRYTQRTKVRKWLG